MRKSTKVTLTVVATVGLESCGRRQPDPCRAETFHEQACQEAVRNRGYYYHGAWVPMSYSNPYPYYYDSYRGYVSSGGAVHADPAEAYSHTGGAPAPAAGVERGGFGAHGAAGEAGE